MPTKYLKLNIDRVLKIWFSRDMVTVHYHKITLKILRGIQQQAAQNCLYVRHGARCMSL